MSSRIEKTADSVTITRTFAAPADLVFACFLEPERVQEWAGCPGTVSMKATGDTRVGGAYRHVLEVEGCGELVMVGTYTEIEAPRKLAYTQRCEAPPGSPPMPETRVSVTFTERGEETEVCLIHSGLIAPEMMDNVESGWAGAFEKLVSCLPARSE